MVLRNNAKIEQIVHVNKLRICVDVWYIAYVQYVACRLKCVAAAAAATVTVTATLSECVRCG